MENEIKVSVCCIAYNHEKYIREALEGFVRQKTNFRYEVLVHDDASTDRTADIIREYAAQYPDIIKPVLQTENQYSKGVRIASTFLFPKMSGKYVALCEGDDYWTNLNKLQMQVDFLESHPDYSACVHNTTIENLRTGTKRVHYSTEDKEIGLADVLVFGGNAYHTSSLIYRASLLKEQPDWVTMVPEVGDYAKSIFLAISGKIWYFGADMSVYRFGVPGSWTQRVAWDAKKSVATWSNTVKMLNEANAYYNYQYAKLFEKAIRRHEYLALLIGREYKKVLHPRYYTEFRKEPLRTRCYVICKVFFPYAINAYEKRKARKKDKRTGN